MAMYKCKMCGGELELVPNSSVCICSYCGSKETVPTQNSEKKMNLFIRANQLRSDCRFSMALHDYEQIVAEFPQEAEAYWGLVLCKYGIEYVDDPSTGKKIPTCHRLSYDSVLEDKDFEMAIEYADSESRPVYRSQAEEIEAIRSRVIEISNKEDPYDIFICYKETDENGDRTNDSVIAESVYDCLKEKGYRVFFSRRTLENKLGQEYEPYIFKALSTAKVMLVFGTKYDYFNAVWVKNEWSRFLDMKRKDNKKTLIPCYKDINAYDMPKEFKMLQAQDMGKVGAIQDLLHGIEKILKPKSKQQPVQNVGATPQTKLERARISLNGGDFQKAVELCDDVLNIEPKNSLAYLYLLFAALEVRNKEEFEKYKGDLFAFKKFPIYEKYVPDEYRKKLMDMACQNRYDIAKEHMEIAPGNGSYENVVASYNTAKELFESISTYKDSKKLAEECEKAVLKTRKQKVTNSHKDTFAEWFCKIFYVLMYGVIPAFVYFTYKVSDIDVIISFSNPRLVAIAWGIIGIGIHSIWHYFQGRGYGEYHLAMRVWNALNFIIELIFIAIFGWAEFCDTDPDMADFVMFGSTSFFIGFIIAYFVIGILGMIISYVVGEDKYY